MIKMFLKFSYFSTSFSFVYLCLPLFTYVQLRHLCTNFVLVSTLIFIFLKKQMEHETLIGPQISVTQMFWTQNLFGFQKKVFNFWHSYFVAPKYFWYQNYFGSKIRPKKYLKQNFFIQNSFLFKTFLIKNFFLCEIFLT